ncbi:MAG: hypothetical protein K2M31_03450 [Muribaculaceae bacterium]|nr:hypothetical protein [Muribaculaceae bacterium]
MNGHRLWSVYTDSGDFANNAGFCAATPDGGVITVAKVRHTDGMLDKNIIFHNSDGSPFEIDWKCERRYYRLAVTKISGDGVIEWNRMVDFSTEPGPAAGGNYSTFWPDVFNVGEGAVDDNGNIYIALNYRNPMKVARNDGSTVEFTPVNNKSWNGDSQGVCGDFMILSLDSEGYYRNAFQLEGACAASYCQKLAWVSETLYCQGYIVGDGESGVNAGEFTLTPTTVMSPLVMALNSDLKPEWAKCYPAEKVGGKNALQNVGISPVGDAIYLCGQYNLKFSDPDDPEKFLTATQGNLREGFILKLEASTGKWIASRNSRDDDWNNPSAVAKTGLTGYFQVIPSPVTTSSVFVFGYVMNAQVGVFLREYKADTLEAILPAGQYNIVTGGGVPSCQYAALDSNNGALYISARGNQAFVLNNGEKTDAPVKWGVLAARFDLGKPTNTVVSSLEEDVDAPAEYFTLEGIRVERPSSGIYICRRGTKVSKIILK